MKIDINPDYAPDNVIDPKHFWKRQDVARLEAWREELRFYNSKVNQLNKG